MEFEGAIQEEIGCYKGGDAWFNKNGVCVPEATYSHKNCVTANWRGGEKDKDGQEITWTYETEIPHEIFMIYEGRQPYCRGIVFKLEDVR